MKKFLKIIGGIIGVLVIAVAVIYFFFPKVLVDQTNASYARAAGLEKKND
ncbi:hypothetical protein ACU8V7_24520 [Zobellia nedashkovskayae]